MVQFFSPFFSIKFNFDPPYDPHLKHKIRKVS